MLDLAVCNGRVVIGGEVLQTDIFIEGGVIVGTGSGAGMPGAREVIDAQGLFVLPGETAGLTRTALPTMVGEGDVIPRRMLQGLACAMLACCLAVPWLGPASPGAVVVALMCVFGATAVGWNGVYLATVARLVKASASPLALPTDSFKQPSRAEFFIEGQLEGRSQP